MEMPLTIAPTMPTNPWSVPQMNRFFKCVVPSYCFSAAPYTAPLSCPVKRRIVQGVNMSLSITAKRKSGTNRTAEATMRSYHASFATR